MRKKQIKHHASLITRRIGALLVCAMLLLNMLPLAAFAEDSFTVPTQLAEPADNTVYWAYDEANTTLHLGNQPYDAADDKKGHTTSSSAWGSYSSEITKVVIDGKIKPTSMTSWFYKMEELTEVVHTDLIDTSSVTSMDSLFFECRKLTSVGDLSGWNVESVTSMRMMFKDCNALTDLNLSSWNVCNVQSMEAMFYFCAELTSLNLSDWDPAAVQSIKHMFSHCEKLTSLDLSGWDTANVTDMEYLFSDCKEMRTLNLSGWNTEKVKIMRVMFMECTNLTSVSGLSGWNVSNVTDMDHMFANCSNLIELDLTDWDPRSTEDTQQMFSGCVALTFVGNLGNWNVRNVEDMSYMFSDCDNLTDLGNIKNWQLDKVKNIAYMFSGCKSLTSIDLSDWNVTQISGTTGLFNNCDNLSEVNLSGWNTEKTIYMMKMFSGCAALTSLDLSGWNTANVTNVVEMFSGCKALTVLNLSNWDLSSATDFSGMVNECLALKEFFTPKIIKSTRPIYLPHEMKDKETDVEYSYISSELGYNRHLVVSTISYLSTVGNTEICFRKTVDGKAEGLEEFTFGVFNENGAKQFDVKNNENGDIFVETKKLPLGKYYVQELTQSTDDLICDTSKQWFTIEEVAEELTNNTVDVGGVEYNAIDPALLENMDLFVTTGSTTIRDTNGKVIMTVRSYCANAFKSCAHGELGKVYVDPTEAEINATRGVTYAGPHQGKLADVLRYILYYDLNAPQTKIWQLLSYDKEFTIDEEKNNAIPSNFHWAIITPPDWSMQPQIVALVTHRPMNGERTSHITKILSPEAEFRNFTVTNTVQPATFQISKTNLGGEPLAGAQMKLETEKGAEIDTWTSQQTAKKFTVAPGNYVLTETTAPGGYNPLSTSVEFTVDSDGNVTVTMVSENDKTLVKEDGKTLVISNRTQPTPPTPPTPPDVETPTPEPEKPEPEKPTPEKPEPEKPTPEKPTPGGETPPDEEPVRLRELPKPGPDSPPTVTVVDEDGVPLGTYVLKETPDGWEYVLIESEDTPQSELPPKTADSNWSLLMAWIVIAATSSAFALFIGISGKPVIKKNRY